jgi:hypothetical protein
MWIAYLRIFQIYENSVADAFNNSFPNILKELKGSLNPLNLKILVDMMK